LVQALQILGQSVVASSPADRPDSLFVSLQGRKKPSKDAKPAPPLADPLNRQSTAMLISTHHGVSGNQLTALPDEFACRHNRRKHPQVAFQALLGLGTAKTPLPKALLRLSVSLTRQIRQKITPS
jgi:hypothetical protein